LIVLYKNLDNYTAAIKAVKSRDIYIRPSSGDISEETEQESTEHNDLISIRLEKSQ